MRVKIHFSPTGSILPLTRATTNQTHHILLDPPSLTDLLPIGNTLSCNGNPIFQVCDHVWVPDGSSTILCPALKTLSEVDSKECTLEISKPGWSVAIVTLSDKGALGLREDRSGPEILEVLKENNFRIGYWQSWILPDDLYQLRGLIAKLCLTNQYDLVITTGSTGVSERDIAPQAIKPLIDLHLPGFDSAMIMMSMKKSANGIISRPVCGIIGKSLLLTLPGSPKAVRENLEAVAGAIPHALNKIHGDKNDCGEMK